MRAGRRGEQRRQRGGRVLRRITNLKAPLLWQRPAGTRAWLCGEVPPPPESREEGRASVPGRASEHHGREAVQRGALRGAEPQVGLGQRMGGREDHEAGLEPAGGGAVGGGLDFLCLVSAALPCPEVRSSPLLSYLKPLQKHLLRCQAQRGRVAWPTASRSAEKWWVGLQPRCPFIRTYI